MAAKQWDKMGAGNHHICMLTMQLLRSISKESSLTCVSSMDHTSHAATNLSSMWKGYIGCMKHGYVWKEENTRWYEPKHLLLGNQYYLHAYGSIYALPRRTVEDVIIRNFNNLRFFANEGKL